MESLRNNFERAWKAVIAPTKYTYNINSLWPKQQQLHGRIVERIDFNVINDEGKTISCLILKEKSIDLHQAVLYFHGNGGTKVEILGVMQYLAQNQVALISFDFIGCGNSDPGYLTYGINESADAEIVLREAYKYLNVEKLTVWGRSMGAVTAINFTVKNPKIVGKLILDSPFRHLQSVIKRVISLQTSLPQVLANIFSYFMRKEIQQKLKFPLFSEDYLQLFKKVPKNLSVLLVCSENDKVVPKQEVQEFYRSFRGDKQLLEITQSHEQDRGQGVYSEIVRWIKRLKTRKNMKLSLYRPSQFFSVQDDEVYTIC